MAQPDRATDALLVPLRSALDGDDWTIADDRPDQVHVHLPDRTLVVDRHDAPGGEPHWSVTLLVGGETVSKFGRFDSTEALCEQVASLQETAVRYTVCCDG